jgi:hypothetical protein
VELAAAIFERCFSARRLKVAVIFFGIRAACSSRDLLERAVASSASPFSELPSAIVNHLSGEIEGAAKLLHAIAPHAVQKRRASRIYFPGCLQQCAVDADRERDANSMQLIAAQCTTIV